jgi:hypothetical protein
VALFKPALLRDVSPVESSNLAVDVVIVRALEIRVVRIHLALGRLAPRATDKDLASARGKLDFSKVNSEHLFVEQRKGRTRLFYLPPLQMRKLV